MQGFRRKNLPAQNTTGRSLAFPFQRICHLLEVNMGICNPLCMSLCIHGISFFRGKDNVFPEKASGIGEKRWDLKFPLRGTECQVCLLLAAACGVVMCMRLISHCEETNSHSLDSQEYL